MQYDLEACTRIAYIAFLENLREYAPHLAEMQPEWEHAPAPLQAVWRSSVEAALRAASAGSA